MPADAAWKWKWNRCQFAKDCKDGWVCSDVFKNADGKDLSESTHLLICAPPLPPHHHSDIKLDLGRYNGIVPAGAHTPYAGYTFLQFPDGTGY